MKAKIAKWGNSNAIRLPKAVLDMLDIGEGSDVEIDVQDRRIIISPIRTDKFNLRQLLEQVSEENLHDELDSGEAAGKELW